MPSFSDLLNWLNEQGTMSVVPGTQDNPFLQGGEEGAVVGSRPVPGSADRNSFSNPNDIAPYNPPGQADDRAMSIADLLDPAGASKYGGQTTTYMQPQFPDYSDLARTLSAYRWRAGGNESQAIPEQYSGDIPPTLLPDFMRLVQAGLPPDVAHSILTQPSYEEGLVPNSPMGQKKGGGPWPYEYKGQEQEGESKLKQDMSPPLRAPGVIDPLQGLNDRLVNRSLNLPTWEGHTPGEDDSLGYYRLPNGQYVPQLSPDHRDPLQYYRQRGNPNSFYWNPAPGTYPVPDYEGQ